MRVPWIKCLAGFMFWGITLAGLCSTRSVLLFSGFKIHRKYAISFFPLHIDHYVVLTKCKKGEAAFSISVPLNTTSDEFSSLFCTKPQTSLSSAASPRSIKWHLQRVRSFLPKPNKAGILQRLQKSGAFSFIRSLLADGKFGRIFHWYEDMELDTNTSSCFRMARRKRYARSNLVLFLPTTFVGVLFSSEFQEAGGAGGLYSASAGGGKGACMGGECQDGGVSDMKHATEAAERIYKEGESASLSRTHLHYLQPSPHSIFDDAQRKDQRNEQRNEQRKAHSKAPQIQPHIEPQDDPQKTQPSLEEKKNLGREKRSWAQDVKSTENELDKEKGEIDGDPENAVPLCPLVADDYATHWLSLSLSQAKLIYHVPYLKSPSYWDPRFPKTDPEEYPDSWMKDVDMTERYTYNSSEQAVLSAALAVTLETMHTKLSSIGPRFSRMIMYKLTMLARLDSSLVLALFLSSVDKAKSIRVVQALQDVWEESMAESITAEEISDALSEIWDESWDTWDSESWEKNMESK